MKFYWLYSCDNGSGKPSSKVKKFSFWLQLLKKIPMENFKAGSTGVRDHFHLGCFGWSVLLSCDDKAYLFPLSLERGPFLFFLAVSDGRKAAHHQERKSTNESFYHLPND